MNLVRSFISIFLIALLAVSIAGWIWAGGQPSPNSEGARLVLALCGLSSIGCLWLLWTARPGFSEPGAGVAESGAGAAGPGSQGHADAT